MKQLTLFNDEIFFDSHANQEDAEKILLKIQKDCVVIGTDEAGRGALAGSVVAAAVILTPEQESELIKMNLRDSKLISLNAREKLFSAMKDLGVSWRASNISPEIIDRENILRASLSAMKKSIENLAKTLVKGQNAVVIVDGNSRIGDLKFPQWNLIRADKIIPVVSAASIIAKVVRDRMMKIYDKRFPEYDFAKNNGYPTKFHIEKIKKIGISDIHRKTFCRKFLEGDEKFLCRQ